MCGIAAVLNRHSPAKAIDLSAIHHRGPDARGSQFLADDHVWLGHTRLAILDLSPLGNQPMYDPSSGNWIVFNGEIFNHKDIRKKLPSQTWRSSSDTETLLAAYASWGLNMLQELRGMYAFVLYDATKRSLLAARDPLGIKPLYYHQTDGLIAFSSEIRPLLQSALIPPESLAGFLRLGAFPETALPLDHLHSLPAGSYLLADLKATQSPQCFWPRDVLTVPVCKPSLQELRGIIDTSIEEHLLSDVPVASFLSGGVDSTIVTTLAARHLGRDLQAFTVSLPGFAGDELTVARDTAKRIGCQHHVITINEEDALHSIPEAVRRMDLPSVDAINTYLVATAVASQGIKVTLSGLGGDELFGGYPSFRDVPRLQRLATIPRPLFKALAPFKPVFRRLADLPRDSSPSTLAAWRRFFATDEDLAPFLPGTHAPQLPPSPQGLDDYSQISWAELSGYTRHLLLRDTDQMTMIHSLEARVPLLDLRLVSYALRLPASWKRSFPHLKGTLIAACQDILPPSCYQGPKQGFELPMDNWIRGPLHGFSQEGLACLRERIPHLTPLITHREKLFAAKSIHWTRLWLLVVLGHYLQRQNLHV